MSDRLIGAALDVGTTTLALYVCDLMSGDVLATASDLNPQIEFGADVMSRIQHCIADKNGWRHSTGASSKASTSSWYAARQTQASSPMTFRTGHGRQHHHAALFLNLSPANFGAAPFVSVISAPSDVKGGNCDW